MLTVEGSLRLLDSQNINITLYIQAQLQLSCLLPHKVATGGVNQTGVYTHCTKLRKHCGKLDIRPGDSVTDLQSVIFPRDEKRDTWQDVRRGLER